MKHTKDIFEKCYTNEGYFGELRIQDDRFFSRPILDPCPETHMNFSGKKCVMWSINNYLGLANHPEVVQASQEALNTFGISSPMGSRMMSGTTSHHLQLEEKFAQWQGAEKALVFNYGYLGVLGIVSALAKPQDTIIMDKFSHACIVDAAFLSRANIRIFKHNNVEDLERILKDTQKQRKEGLLILIEGMYGMTGDLAKLKQIVDMKKYYGARLFVDDAHGCGVLGDSGRGIGELMELSHEIDIYFGTYAKAFAAIGGFAVAQKEVINWIEYNARTQIFAKALPMIYVKTVEKMLELIAGSEGAIRREKMWQNSHALKQGLQAEGFHIGSGKSPIVSIYIPIGEDAPLHSIAPQTIKLLRDKGVFVSGVMHPVIPHGLVMYRMIPTANHSKEEINYTIRQFVAMRDELNLNTAMTENEQQSLSSIYA